MEKQQTEAEEAPEVPVDHLKLPVGTIVSDPVKGDFLTIPLFGWIGHRVRTRTPLVMLTTLLIPSLEEPAPRGTLQIELPIFEDTELQTLAVLERYGWDGRVWPHDPGWPDSDDEQAESLKGLIAQADLKSTFVFPNSGALPVTVSRARGPFLMPPLEAATEEANPVKLAKLRELCSRPWV